MKIDINQTRSGVPIFVLDDPIQVSSLDVSDFDSIGIKLSSSFQNFEPLVCVADKIRWLFSCKPKSWNGIEKFQSVEKITFGTAQAPNIDFRIFERLKYFSAGYAGDIEIKMLNHPKIEHLDLMDWKVKSLSDLSEMAGLKYLLLNNCGTKSLVGLEGIRALEALRLDYATALADVQDLKYCSKLLSLHIHGARRLLDVSPIRCLSKLRFLSVDAKNSKFDDIDWLGGMPTLRCAYIGVPVENIDWNVIGRHPCLYDITIMLPVGHPGYVKHDVVEQLTAVGRKVVEFAFEKSTRRIFLSMEPHFGLIDPQPHWVYDSNFPAIPPA